ncbi:hypothetical protein SAMN05216474_0900 [Lishizhenia tianjinensis]|uniref:Uncharacterized protein n=1 Tax=Lishizhenia tianjinensis TaxID=477690 RepID=A0A1I6YH32_9FLAO|nr:hypothetical protein SAMN05216474_0900 [Lishizhenia tianjinensis]
MTFLNITKLSLVLLLFTSCARNNGSEVELLTEKIVEYFQGKGIENVFESKRAFVFFSGEKSCVKCTESLIVEMNPYLDSTDVVFMVSGRGAVMDITSFVEKERENVYLDPYYKFSKAVGENSSGYILFEDGVADTVVHVNVKDLVTQIQLLKRHIEN